MIEARELTKVFGRRRVVDGVSFAVRQGEILGLVGPNGAGKSTLLAMVAGALPPTAGEVRIAGHSLARSPRRGAGLIGYVPQELALHTGLTVLDNLRFWGLMAGAGRRELEERIPAVVQVTGLGSVLGARVQTLSGGMKRKLHIATALLHDPPVLILDEPTAGIDLQSAREITAFIRAQARAGKAVLYSTHSVEEVARLCDRVLILHQGRALFTGTLAAARAAAAARAPTAEDPDRLPLEEVIGRLGGW